MFSGNSILEMLLLWSFALFCFSSLVVTNCELNLPREHVPYYFFTFPNELNKCKDDSSCLYHDLTKLQSVCWGYEDTCPKNVSYRRPLCSGDHRGWVRTKEEQFDTFFAQADFGYVKAHRDSVQIICEPTFRDDSVLECSDHLQFCRGRNLLLNLTHLSELGTWRYRMDVLRPGDLAGWCHIHEGRIENKSDHMSPLQSWAPEMRNFQKLKQKLRPEEDCDIYFDQPTFIIKIDATVNMYHHLCDFLNLYASLHVNNSHPSMFSDDVKILIWETYPYHSAFRDMWLPFTKHPVSTIDEYAGRSLCFRNVVFPLLPRMIFGLYYNTPLVYGCENSGLFKAFSQHILHRLKIPDTIRDNGNVRVTLLSRETSHRNVINEGELLAALKSESGVQVERVVYGQRIPFRQQLAITQATDLLIGIHGAGLTHLLFLPDWGAVFELYNCEDENCYSDLARLRGVKYATWQQKDKMSQVGESRHPNGGVHAKFTDYSFDVDEFMNIVRRLLKYIRDRKDFKEKIHRSEKDEL